MHELSLAADLLETLQRASIEHGFGRVSTVFLEVGALCCVDGEALRTALQALAADDGLLGGAGIELRVAPGQLCCRYCRATFAADELYTPCPVCRRYGARIVAGDDARLAAVDVYPAAEADMKIPSSCGRASSGPQT